MLRLGPLTTQLIGVLALFATLPSQGIAQQLPEIGTLVREEKPVAMSEPVFRRLEAAHEFYGTGEIDQALERLENLQNLRLSPYEAALVEQTFGFCYLQLGNVERALEAFEQTLSLDGLQNVAQQEMRYSLASLYAISGPVVTLIHVRRRRAARRAAAALPPEQRSK